MADKHMVENLNWFDVPDGGGGYGLTRTTAITADRNRRKKPKPACAYPTKMSILVEEVRRGVGSWTVYPGGKAKPVQHHSVVTNRQWIAWSRWADNSQSLERGLVNKLLKHTKDEHVNAAMVLAQLDKTLALWSDTAKNLHAAWRELRRMKLPKKEFARLWLIAQYGFLPTLSDIKGSIELLGKQAEDASLIKCVKADVSATYRHDVMEIQGLVAPNRWEVSHSGSLQVNLTGRLAFKISVKGLHTAKMAGLTNPLNLAWELIPFSFVVDWMIPVGEYLSGLDALVGVDLVSPPTMDVKMESTDAYSGLGCSLTGKSFSFQRALAYKVPFKPSLPLYKPSTNKMNVLNGLALLVAIRA